MENEHKPEDARTDQYLQDEQPDPGTEDSRSRTGYAAPVERVSEEEAESALSRAYRQYQDDSSQDTFIEVIVKRKMQSADYLKIAGIIVAYVVLLTLILVLSGQIPFLMSLLPLFIIGGAFGAWWLITGMNKEYEYVVTKGDLDIDTIVAQRRRRRTFSVKARNIELMASCKSDDYKTHVKQQNLKVLNLAARPDDPANWFIITQFEGARTMAIITGNEKIIRNMHRYSPSRVRFNPAVGIV